MTDLPHSVMDFATALKTMITSQRDVMALTSAWSDLINTTTPMSVEVNLSSGVQKVDNLAKIKQDITESLSSKNPTVNSINFEGTAGGPGTYSSMTPNEWVGRHWLTDDVYNPDMSNNWVAYNYGYQNVLRTIELVTMEEITVNMNDLPEVLCVGNPSSGDTNAKTSLKLTIKSIRAEFTLNNRFQGGRHYYTKVLFVNRLNDTFNLRIYDNMGRLLQDKAIEAYNSVEYLVFGMPGQDGINVQELVYSTPSGEE